MPHRPAKRGLFLALMIFVAGIFLAAPACTNTKYYNRYNKDKACKMQDQGAKQARKNK